VGGQVDMGSVHETDVVVGSVHETEDAAGRGGFCARNG
jgi:hypothetical protein